MKFDKCFKHAYIMVINSQLRAWLTILGIVIGVAAVISIISLSDTMEQKVNAQLSTLGGDIVTITPGFVRGSAMAGMGGPGGPEGPGGGRGPPPPPGSEGLAEETMLTRSDFQVLKGMPDITMIDTNIRGSVEVSYLGKKGRISATGVDQKVWSKITTDILKDGRMLDSADQNVIVIGGSLSSSFFKYPVGINKMITIENRTFRVVGILDDETNNIYMPIQIAYQVINNKEIGNYDTLVVKIKNEDQLDKTLTKIEKKLMISRHVTQNDKDFTVISSKKMQQRAVEMMNALNTFLLAIAAVSLIVGSVGVANTMFTSVLEKTKEIGIMKAIGARNNDILLIFLFNAVLIGLVGGIIGIIIGAILSYFLPSIMGDTPLKDTTVIVSLNSIIIALFVSVIVGMIAGIIPAYKASKLRPVDALRYE